jgi:hypothetical protein
MLLGSDSALSQRALQVTLAADGFLLQKFQDGPLS